MFGIRKLKEQMSKLTHRVDLMEAELNRTSYRANQAELKCKILELEIKYPPKFKTGDVVGRYRVIEHSHFDSRGERHYRCLSSRSESLEDVRESNLSLAKAQEK